MERAYLRWTQQARERSESTIAMLNGEFKNLILLVRLSDDALFTILMIAKSHVFGNEGLDGPIDSGLVGDGGEVYFSFLNK